MIQIGNALAVGYGNPLAITGRNHPNNDQFLQHLILGERILTGIEQVDKVNADVLEKEIPE